MYLIKHFQPKSRLITLKLLILAFLFLWRYLKRRGYVCCAPTKFNIALLKKCPTIKNGVFKPTLYLQHALLQSFFGDRLAPRLATIQYTLEECKMPGGGHTTLAWPSHKDNSINIKHKDILVVIIPGLTGSATENYMIELVSTLMKSGYRCVIFHPRLNGERFTLPDEGHMDIVTDFKAALDYILKKEQGVKLFGIGHSFGANLLLNYFGEYTKDNGFMGGICIANPFNLILSENKIRGSIIDKFLASNIWEKILGSKASLTQSKHVKLNIEESMRHKCIRIYDELFSLSAYGYECIDDYYWRISSHRKLRHVTVPLFMLQAHDDLVVAPNAFVQREVQSNPNVILKMTSQGGHLGWIEGFFNLKRWYLKPVMEYLDAVVGMGETSVSG